jgi:hypothetical protein
MPQEFIPIIILTLVDNAAIFLIVNLSYSVYNLLKIKLNYFLV